MDVVRVVLVSFRDTVVLHISYNCDFEAETRRTVAYIAALGFVLEFGPDRWARYEPKTSNTPAGMGTGTQVCFSSHAGSIHWTSAMVPLRISTYLVGS
jgi:hypothetical protein